MIRITLRLPEELHAKLRWLAYKERRSQKTSCWKWSRKRCHAWKCLRRGGHERDERLSTEVHTRGVEPSRARQCFGLAASPRVGTSLHRHAGGARAVAPRAAARDPRVCRAEQHRDRRGVPRGHQCIPARGEAHRVPPDGRSGQGRPEHWHAPRARHEPVLARQRTGQDAVARPPASRRRGGVLVRPGGGP